MVYTYINNNGNAESYHIARNLECNEYDNATVLPAKFKGFKENPWCSGGVIDIDNRYITNSAHPALLDGQYDVNEYTISNEIVLYFGIFFKQWGHFILEEISRLWPIIKNPSKYDKIKIIYLPMGNYKMDGNFLQFLNLLGIKEEQLISITTPTKFKKVIIPDMCSYNPRYTYTNEYNEIIATVIRNSLNTSGKIEVFDKIYLSHSQWKMAEERDIGEAYIENAFLLNGYHSISPEKFSLAEQIKIIHHASMIVSSVSTLSHNILFASKSAQCILINKLIRSRFQEMVNEACGIKPIYIDAHLSFLPSSGGSGPFLYDINENLINFFKDFHYKQPDYFDRKYNIRKYIEVFISMYKRGVFNKGDFDKISTKIIRSFEDRAIRDIISTMLEMIEENGNKDSAA